MTRFVKRRPLALGQQRREVALDLLGILGAREAEPAVHALHVRVDRETGDAEGVAQHHVRGLARDAAQRDEVVQHARAPRPPKRSTRSRAADWIDFAFWR